MAEGKSQFEVFLAEQIEKYRGVAFPVYTPWLWRKLVRKVNPKILHPNPEDEFCDPRIGPNYGIISKYEREYEAAKRDHTRDILTETLTVERMKPDGYLLLNGHHRWAAALRQNVRRVPIEIVNVTHVIDIQKMLQNTHNDKRVVMDLDEVVLAAPGDTQVEKALPFPMNLSYRRRLRLGVPALFSFFKGRGYDIWVYSSKYYSLNRIKRLFLLHGVTIDGIVTGVKRGKLHRGRDREKIHELIANQYPRTVNIDGNSVVFIDSRTKMFEEYTLSGAPENWSREVMDAFEQHKKQEKSEAKSL